MSKKRSHRNIKQSRVPSHRPFQKEKQRSLFWAFVAVACFIAFFGILGAASTAQSQSNSGSSTLNHKLQVAQQQINAGRAHPRPKPTDPQPPTAQPAPTLQAGISNLPQGPFLSSYFAVRNSWQGPVDGTWVLAYAGDRPGTDGAADAGGMVLYTKTANQQGGFDMHPLGMFLAPAGTTSLTIIKQQGTLLSLTSETGKQLTFNLVTRQFQ